MSTVNRSALVPYSAQQMFDLVNDTASYPQFVPYCCKADVHRNTAHEQQATLFFAKGAIKTSFTTSNRLVFGKRIEVTLVNGPFKKLNGVWEFIAIGDSSCRVQLHMEFELSNPLLKATLGKLFDQICDRLVTTFVQRAGSVYTKDGSHHAS